MRSWRTGADQRAHAAAVAELDRVLAGVWERASRPAVGHTHPGAGVVLGIPDVSTDAAAMLRGGLKESRADLDAVEREVTVRLRFTGCDRAEANIVAAEIAAAAVQHTGNLVEATVETDPVCQCGHPASRHELEVNGDTRCLVVGPRTDLVDVFDDGRATTLGTCACLWFRRRR